MTRFQLYPERELAYKYNTPPYKSQYSEILVEYEQGFDMNKGKVITIQQATHHHLTNDENSYIPVHLLKNTEQTARKVKPQHKYSTSLQELPHINDTYFGAIHYDIYLEMKLIYTMSRIF